MFDNILFYVVFLSQVIMISYYYPRKILGRVKYILEQKKPSEYPKLYPKPLAHYEKTQRNFYIINQVILVIGVFFLLLVIFGEYSLEDKRSEIIPFIYFMIQVFPFFLMEYFGFAYFKLMRKADLRTIRKAELQPRRLFDFVSPILVVLAILMNIACIIFFYNLHDFQFHFSNDTLIMAITLILSNTLYAATIYWHLHGKKINPHQNSKDRIKQIEVTIKSLIFMSIGASLFLIIIGGIDHYQFDSLEPIMMSLYLQFVVFIGLGYILRNLRIENLDFEVYKEANAT